MLENSTYSQRVKYLSTKQPLWSNRAFGLFLLLSLLVHILFFIGSQTIKVGTVGEKESEIGELFKVQFRDLESENFISRPTNTQLREEREQLLAQQMSELAQESLQATGEELTSVEEVSKEEPIEEVEEEGEESLFQQDQMAQNLIASDQGKQEVRNFEDEAAEDIIDDEVNQQRLSLTGRGTGTQNRIMASLPKPIERNDPIITRSMAFNTTMERAPDMPQLQFDEPPIEIPPVTEILPSPELMRPAPEIPTLPQEEVAVEELKDRFVQLDDLLDVQLQTYHHIGGDGYFMVTIKPKAADERLRVLPKDVVFILDASTSMGKRRLGVIKEEIKELLQRLRPDDRFNIVGFKRDIKKFVRTLAPVNDEMLRQAWMFTSPLEASGRTDIYTSLQPLVQLGTERARPLTMILISDGRPTFGVVNSRKIINNLSQFLGPSTSIYCIGTGDILNRYLLDMLAFRNRGMVAFEKSRNELPKVIKSVFGYIEDPVLLKLDVDFEGLNSDEIYPKRLPDLYMKGEVRIWGRLHGEKSITMRLVGEAFDEQKEIIVELPVPEMDNATYEIARQWAFHKAYNIIGNMVEEGNQAESLQEIRNLSQTYRIVTPYSEEIGLN